MKPTNEEIQTYISDFVMSLDGYGLIITDEDNLSDRFDEISETDYKLLRNDIFQDDKVENLLIVLNNQYFLSMLIDFSNGIYEKEIQAVLDAMKELEA